MILLIDNYDSFTYNLYQLIVQTGQSVQVVRNDQITLDEIASLKPEAIILSPGPGRPEDAGICIEVIRRFGSEIPILGVCLGQQAIGIAFGGSVIQAPEILHGKRSLIFHRRQGMFQNVPLPFHVGRYHSLVIDHTKLPSCLRVEAETIEGMIMAVRHVDYPCFGVQFHPESILTEHGTLLIANFLEQIRERAPC
jgi:anthranilate synthase component 2